MQTLVWIHLAASALVIGVAVLKFGMLELLPSLGWSMLMTLPFTLQSNTLGDGGARAVQFFGVFVVGLALLLGDIFSRSIQARIFSQVNFTLADHLSDYRPFMFWFLALAGAHVALMDHVPLFEQLRGVRDDRVLLQMREATSKLLEVPELLKFAFVWALTIAAPLTIYLLVVRRKLVLASAFAVICVLYARASLAKLPLYLLVTSCTLLLLPEIPKARRRLVLTIALVISIPIAMNAALFLASNPLSVFRYGPPKERLEGLVASSTSAMLPLTLGDRLRLMPKEEELTLTSSQRRYNYLVYRMFLVPAEVSSRWYEYFPRKSDGYIGTEGLVPGSRDRGYSHPANRVGLWAYASRFPAQYLASVHAYASIDADAYARFGVAGILGVGVVTLLLRVGLCALRVSSPVTDALYVIGLTLIAVLWPMASLQAALVANGILLVLMLMYLYRRLATTQFQRELPAK